MSLDPELQSTLARLLMIAVIIALTLFLRHKAPSFAQRLARTFWRVVSLVRRRNIVSDDDIVRAITPPVQLLITLVGLQLVLFLVEIPDRFQRLQVQIMTALAAFMIFWTIYRLVDIVARYISGAPQFFRVDQTIISFGSQVAKALIIVCLFVIVMSSFGFDLGGVVAGLGIGGLAVALAAQDALANLFGYFVIVMDAPFKVGNYIVVNNVEGTVEAITFRSTRLRMGDRALIVIPNQTIVNGTIINWSRVDRRMIRMTLGVTYGTSEEQLRAVVADIRKMLESHERVIKSEQLVVEFVEYGSSSLNILVSFYVNTIKWDQLQAIKADINYRLMQILRREQVKVALPTTTITLDGSAVEALKPELVMEPSK